MTGNLIRRLTVSGLLAVTLAASTSAQQPGPPVRAITNVRGDLYRVQDNDHFTVFLVTPGGIILADPISVSAATWLKGELATRFPNRAVRYVLASHHDWDHASGARVFNDTAEVIGHEAFNVELRRASSSMPPSLVNLDRNRNQVLERAEVEGSPVGAFILSQDRNGDGNVPPAEFFQDVMPVESTYSDRRTITLSGKTVHLVHPGRGHTADTTVLHFPAERVVFGVDLVWIKQVPVSVDPSPQEMITTLRAVEALDFDTVVAGHGVIGTGSRADVTTSRTYLEDLTALVQAGITAGQTVEQLQASPALDKYKDWTNFATRKNANLAALYAQLRAAR